MRSIWKEGVSRLTYHHVLDWWLTKATKSLMTADNPAEIRSKHLPDTSTKRVNTARTLQFLLKGFDDGV
jgi:hypothetical protein